MMRFNLSALAVRERAITLFLIVAVMVSGLYAFVHLGRAEDPTFPIKVFTVTAVWPGATAKEMQDLVADPLEKRMQELRWYDHVETFTRPGIAVMMVKLGENTPPADVPEQFYQARKKLGDEAHDLPDGVRGPYINDEYSDVDFALYAIQARGIPPRELTREAETLRQKLLHVPGVKKVNILGERPERIFVGLSNARLATLGVSAGDIFAALQHQNTVTPAGSIDTSGAQVFLRPGGAYDDLRQIRATPIAAGGRVFRLGDIAKITRGYQDPPTYLIRNNGKPALVLAVVMKNGWNGLVLGRALEAERAKIAEGLPAGVSFSKITDQAVNIRSAVNEFMLKFFVALGVIMLVSLISLGWRVGVVVAAAVPLTLAAVFVIMMMTGRDFDRITLGALIIALGLLVDDAIIATEMMVVKLEEGLDRIKAAAYAWSHTAAPMLAGTLVTVIGFTPVGFAQSNVGEYAGNIFWVVGFALVASWVVAVVFTPYLGVKLLPDIKPMPGGREAIYATPRYKRLRRWIGAAVDHKFTVAAAVVGALLLAGVGMSLVKQQFFPTSDRPELLVDVQMPEGTAIETTRAAALKVESWLRQQPEAKIVTTYIGQGAPRFFFSYNPELPDPSFAKLIVLTPNAKARDRLKLRLRQRIADGLAPGALIRVSQLFFGPFPRYLVNFRVMGPDPAVLRGIAAKVERVMRSDPHTRLVNENWGNLVPTEHFVLDQSRLALLGLSPTEVAQQLQFLLTGVAITQVREGIRTVEVVARSSGSDRLDPAKLADLTLRSRDGRLIPLSQVGHFQVRWENPVLRRRDRTPTITVWCDYDESLQPPQVSKEIWKALAPIRAHLPVGYQIQMGGNIEDAAKGNASLAPVFPVMILLTLLVLVLQTRSLAATTIVFLTAPLGLVGTVPFLLLLHQPFGFNAILGLIGLSGILMRNTLILIGQIRMNLAEGLDPYHAVIEATVQRARPVILTALAAVLAFIPLTTSVFWGSMAVTLIGGTIGGTVLTLLFLPALYAIWFHIRAAEEEFPAAQPEPAG